MGGERARGWAGGRGEDVEVRGQWAQGCGEAGGATWGGGDMRGRCGLLHSSPAPKGWGTAVE